MTPTPLAQLNDSADSFLDLTNGVYWLALVIALGGLIVGGAMWALGTNSSNRRMETQAKRLLGTSILVAMLLGATPGIVRWASDLADDPPAPDRQGGEDDSYFEDLPDPVEDDTSSSTTTVPGAPAPVPAPPPG